MPTPSGVGFAQDPAVTPGLGPCMLLLFTAEAPRAAWSWGFDDVGKSCTRGGSWAGVGASFGHDATNQ
jgi:hypothetical protein